jgi:acyl-[acyl-carrier-protein]-phospholipid O-acyltransferase/long-chain-fatty-acid--[acyl-carrier-protein] ligase
MQIYMKRCSAAQFGSLRLVVAGAEKLPQPFALKFAEKFGVPISEGYGCTECSPVIAVNAPEYRRGGVMQSGACAGSVGRLLPAVRVRVVDPDSGEPVAAGEPGLLKVHGPNIMVGYLGQPEKTAEVLQDGWYTTGDIVRIDAEGFIHITDRLSRFSKIGGEMVPHGKVEEALHAVINAVEQIFAVTSIRDEKKGERLAVIHCQCEHEIEFVVKELQGNGLPNIFIPKPRDFVLVGALPVLGTGKLDLRALKRIAQERLS